MHLRGKLLYGGGSEQVRCTYRSAINPRRSHDLYILKHNSHMTEAQKDQIESKFLNFKIISLGGYSFVNCHRKFVCYVILYWYTVREGGLYIQNEVKNLIQIQITINVSNKIKRQIKKEIECRISSVVERQAKRKSTKVRKKACNKTKKRSQERSSTKLTIKASKKVKLMIRSKMKSRAKSKLNIKLQDNF
jgi:hypothetical protein